MGKNLYYLVAHVVMMLTGGAQVVGSERVPETFARLFYLINGDFSAKMETMDDKGNPVMFNANVSFVPVIVPGIKNATMIYRELYPVERNMIIELTLDSNNIAHTTFYEVQDADVHESLEHTPARLSKDASTDVALGCKATTKEVEIGFFQGNWVDCTREVNGQFPVYVYEITCEYFKIIIDMGTESLQVQYDYQANSRYAWVPEILAKMNTTEDPCHRD